MNLESAAMALHGEIQAKSKNSLLPRNKRAAIAAVVSDLAKKAPAHSIIATKSFEEAAADCRSRIEAIGVECRRANRKYRDAHFDLLNDTHFCIHGLVNECSSFPQRVARVEDLFENPKFFQDGAQAGDITQGCVGDCWFLAAIATVTNVEGLVEKLCVARDEVVGAYGFVFMRDGEWVPVIVDDQLACQHHEFDDSEMAQTMFQGKESLYNAGFSKSLLFSRCKDPNETWLPLLEKAYAKAHGDYWSIEGGYTGEGVEDLTGGVTSQLFTTDILDKDLFWKDELSKVNKGFLFAGSVDDRPFKSEIGTRQGVIKGHAYSVLRAVEHDGQRLVLLRNPWGKVEWNGAWSDGSKEWTAEWIQRLGHKFGDDGQFWMSYRDVLRKFTVIDRTRLFNEDWSVSESRWIKYSVPWSEEYCPTRFEFEVTKPTPVVIVLSQLDTRYFRGLEGQYTFSLSFRVHIKGESEYITRSRTNVDMSRSTNCELTLEPATYVVIFSVEATFESDDKKASEVAEEHKNTQRAKFRQIAMSADLAYAKAGSKSFWRGDDDEEEEKEKRKEKEKKEKEKEEKKASKKGKKGEKKDDEDDEKKEEKKEEKKDKKEAGCDADDAAAAEEENDKKEEKEEKDEETEDKEDKEDKEDDNDAEDENEDSDDEDEDSDYDSDSDSDSDAGSSSGDDSWNARVCVGLRVYSHDRELTVTIVEEPKKPKRPQPEGCVDLDDNTRPVDKDGEGDAGSDVAEAGSDDDEEEEDEEGEGKKEKKAGKKCDENKEGEEEKDEKKEEEEKKDEEK
ncbi:hypothetical protein EDC01DRAFT_345403 [Geopyxis carbonaria]|nr:hypothetical protein EDC01DRAFT_345403 [Geopyxis carbonaria]